MQIGIGGSINSARIFAEYLPRSEQRFQPSCLDTLAPRTLRRFFSSLDPRKVAFLIASKGGTTAEVLILLKLVEELLYPGSFKSLRQRLFILSDRGSPIDPRIEVSPHLPGPIELLLPSRELLDPDHFLETPADTGGRFSAFHALGLALYLLCGGDSDPIVEAVVKTDDQIEKGELPFPFLPVLEEILKDHPFLFWELSFPRSLFSLSLWVEQLLGESLGKEGKGVIPVPPQVSVRRSFPWFSLFYRTRRKSLLGNPYGFSSLRVVSDLESCAGEMRRFMHAVIRLGATMGVNPADQPDVESAKRFTRKYLEQRMMDPDFTETLMKKEERFFIVSKSEDLSDTLSGRDFLYLAVLSYLEETPKVAETLERWGKSLGIPFLLQTGPRYLHSLGQLFKGGPKPAFFLLLTESLEEDLFFKSFPRKPLALAEFLFLQAYGDASALREAGQRVLHVHFPTGWRKGLSPFLTTLASCKDPLFRL